jgi:hypothetical protein
MGALIMWSLLIWLLETLNNLIYLVLNNNIEIVLKFLINLIFLKSVKNIRKFI